MARQSENKSIHPDVLVLHEDNVLSFKNVKSWISENEELLKCLKHLKKSNDRKDLAKYYFIETYVHHLKRYLRTGVYESLFYGNNAQHKIQTKVVAMAYSKDGTIKRNVGWWYPDIGIYTKEMSEYDI